MYDRTITLRLITDSKEELDVLLDDLQAEIGCCWNNFEVVMIKEEQGENI